MKTIKIGYNCPYCGRRYTNYIDLHEGDKIELTDSCNKDHDDKYTIKLEINIEKCQK